MGYIKTYLQKLTLSINEEPDELLDGVIKKIE
ncbi:MAG: hypothetical protein JWR61_2477 [Ferruginibacter sp.]|nr:hypothetical protein [Ferruginibacter sp.]